MSFFLSNKFLFKLIFVAILLWIFSLYLLLSLFIAFTVLGLFLFRKKINLLNRNENIEKTSIKSPVSGKVVSINDDQGKTKITIKTDFFSGYGLYLPINSNITSLKVDNSCVIIILNDKKIDIKLSLYSSFDKFIPRVYTDSGDRGVQGTNIGYLPFGGKTVIEFPRQENLKIKEGERIEACKSLLSGFEIEN